MRRPRVPAGTWKWLGLAGLAGVAATGAVVARDERRRRAATPEDVRARLHERQQELKRQALIDLTTRDTP